MFLVHAVSKHCKSRGAYLTGIMNLDDTVQEYVKQIVEKYPSNDIPDEEGGELPEDDDVTKEVSWHELQEDLKLTTIEHDETKADLAKICALYEKKVAKDQDEANQLSMLKGNVPVIYTPIHSYTLIYTHIHSYTLLYTLQYGVQYPSKLYVVPPLISSYATHFLIYHSFPD